MLFMTEDIEKDGATKRMPTKAYRAPKRRVSLLKKVQDPVTLLFDYPRDMLTVITLV